MNKAGLDLLEDRIDYQFKNRELLAQALTHPSCGLSYNYERLEFLGDAVLELAVSDYLYNNLKNFPEGALTQKRAEIVCAKSLVEVARTIGLGAHLALGKGEEQTDGRNKPSILENAMEAVLGAIYLDGGYHAAQNSVNKLFHDIIMHTIHSKHASDYKSQLQETVQKTASCTDICYTVIKQEGPPHDMIFYVQLTIDSKVVCEGVGSSKKEAEQNAAKCAIENLLI